MGHLRKSCAESDTEPNRYSNTDTDPDCNSDSDSNTEPDSDSNTQPDSDCDAGGGCDGYGLGFSLDRR